MKTERFPLNPDSKTANRQYAQRRLPYLIARIGGLSRHLQFAAPGLQIPLAYSHRARTLSHLEDFVFGPSERSPQPWANQVVGRAQSGES